MSDEEKRKLIELKDDDTPGIRDMKTELQLTLDMEPGERRVFYQEMRIKDFEHELQSMIESNKQDDALVWGFSKRAKDLVEVYKLEKDESLLHAAEQYMELAKSTKQAKYSIKDIRGMRERIWQEKRKLNQLKTTTKGEPSKS